MIIKKQIQYAYTLFNDKLMFTELNLHKLYILISKDSHINMYITCDVLAPTLST